MTGTQPGVVVGTVGYMSPEQASGEALDFRSDQFSFGSILYEMATGKRAFQKKTASTRSRDPERGARADRQLNPQAPAPLRWIVERCLAKEPRGRYASTEDLARELESLADHFPNRGSRARGLLCAPRLAFGPRWAAAGISLLARVSGRDAALENDAVDGAGSSR